jgi:hypothetical protein
VSVPQIEVSLEAVIVAVTEGRPRILTVTAGDAVPRLPSGLLDVEDDPTLELGMRRLISAQAGISVGYVEQLYTFGDRNRIGPPGSSRPRRSIGIGYVILTHEAATTGRWIDWYELFPWEDRRGGSSRSTGLVERLREWAGNDPSRRERLQISFGLGDTPWDGVRALERYELLYEARLVDEWFADHDPSAERGTPPSMAMALDHRRVAATGLSRLRGKLTYRPVVFELLPELFTLTRLQTTVEALAGEELHPQNFRRLIDRSGLVEDAGRSVSTGGRPAKLVRFRREVLRERPRVGVGLP